MYVVHLYDIEFWEKRCNLRYFQVVWVLVILLHNMNRFTFSEKGISQNNHYITTDVVAYFEFLFAIVQF